MTEVTTIGLDIAKQIFHAHGADAAGRAVFSRRITRGKLLDSLPSNHTVWWHWRHAAARITGRVN